MLKELDPESRIERIVRVTSADDMTLLPTAANAACAQVDWLQTFGVEEDNPGTVLARGWR